MKRNKDSIGDRMKENYENRGRFALTRRIPVIIRVDGRAFHTLTKKCWKPFDAHFITSMQIAALKTAESIQGCKAVYTQSDEASFLITDYSGLDSQAWFDYNKSKIETVSASTMTAHFNQSWNKNNASFGVFDGRSFNIPKEEVVNYFIWRMRDWERNSVNMMSLAHFSTKELHGKNSDERKQMLLDAGHDWNKLEFNRKFGTLFINQGGKFQIQEMPFTYSDIDAALKESL
jgi:tRNA(His) 5'-end guanylyltransferase